MHVASTKADQDKTAQSPTAEGGEAVANLKATARLSDLVSAWPFVGVLDRMMLRSFQTRKAHRTEDGGTVLIHCQSSSET